MCWEQPLSKSNVQAPQSPRRSMSSTFHSPLSFSLPLFLCAGLVLHALCLLVRDIHSSWFEREREISGLRKDFELEVEKECHCVVGGWGGCKVD